MQIVESEIKNVNEGSISWLALYKAHAVAQLNNEDGHHLRSVHRKKLNDAKSKCANDYPQSGRVCHMNVLMHKQVLWRLPWLSGAKLNWIAYFSGQKPLFIALRMQINRVIATQTPSVLSGFIEVLTFTLLKCFVRLTLYADSVKWKQLCRTWGRAPKLVDPWIVVEGCPNDASHASYAGRVNITTMSYHLFLFGRRKREIEYLYFFPFKLNKARWQIK